MQYVYAVVFDGNIVKFGRSVNPWKRIYNHVSDGKRYNQIATLAFVSQVNDAVKAENELLIEASWVMDEISQESFKFKSLGDISGCFDAVRLGYMAFNISLKPYRLIVDENTFDFEHDTHCRIDINNDPLLSVKRGIASSVSGKDYVRIDIVKASNRTRRVSDIKACLIEMENSGHIIIERWKNPFSGDPSNDLDKAKFRYTEKLSEYLR